LKYLLLALAWTAYCTLHSAMISETATGLLKRRLGDSFRFYRLLFNSIAMLTLIPVLWYAHSLGQEAIFRWEGVWRVLQYLLLGCGILLVVAGGRHYSFGQFVGISQLRGASSGGLATGGGIDSSGILGLVRHPWYTAVVLLLWAGRLDLAALVGNSVLTAYVVIGTLLEERKLVHEFGDAYRSYQRRVSMFVPLKWIRLRIAP
jgi:protein-S-isoprenylcysteine O-methyltransferase Ste14